MTDTIIDPERESWLHARRGGFGASDMANALTGTYGGGVSVVADKLGYDTDDRKNLKEKQRGHDWEERIADAVHILTGCYIHAEQSHIVAAHDPRAMCTVDGLVDDRAEIMHVDDAEGVLEIKTHDEHIDAKWDYFEAQCQWQMYVTGKQWVLLVVVKFVTDPTTERVLPQFNPQIVHRDDYLIGILVDLADQLWAHVEAGTLPEPDEFTPVELVREVHRHGLSLQDHKGREVINETIDIDPLAGDLERYKIVCKAHSALEDEKHDIEKRLRTHMDGAVLAQTSDGRWQLRVGRPIAKFTTDSEDDALGMMPDYSRTVLDRARFKLEQPELHEALKRPTNDRRVTVIEINEKRRKPRDVRIAKAVVSTTGAF
jgi:predicted phage-related endonuclease